MWVARDSDGRLELFVNRPERMKHHNLWQRGMVGLAMPINPALFPNLTWEDEPIEVELIKKK